MSADHRHGHDDVSGSRNARRRALWSSLALNAGFLSVEVVGGLVFGSLALLADAVHMASDVGALAIALIALQLAARPASDRHTYGLQRAEVLGALVSAIILVAAAGWICIEAFRRFGEPVDIQGGGVAAIAVVGLAINTGSAVLLLRSAGRSLNMRGAFWHMASDALGSVAALAAGLAIVIWDATWVDLAASLAVAALVVVGGWRLLRDTTRVLLEAAPVHLDPTELTAAMLADTQVLAVHHLHLWSLGSETEALSAHVVVDGEPSLHDAQAVADRLKQMLHASFGVAHATLEVECHPCDTDPAHPSGATEAP
ncbi:MAG: cation diffusion facilitator family transporter [Actinomycetota bacterium]